LKSSKTAKTTAKEVEAEIFAEAEDAYEDELIIEKI